MIIFYSGRGSGVNDKEERIGISEAEIILGDAKANIMLTYADNHKRKPEKRIRRRRKALRKLVKV